MKVAAQNYITAASKQPWLWTYLYYILSEMKNTSRPAQIKTSHQTFDT